MLHIYDDFKFASFVYIELLLSADSSPPKANKLLGFFLDAAIFESYKENKLSPWLF